MSVNDEDEVVEEIPVYLSHVFKDLLYIFQYPVIPASVEGGVGQILKSQIKPQNQHVRLEMGLDTTSANYDKTHGEQIAVSLEKESTSDKVYSGKLMDKMEFTSTKCVEEHDSYCLGQVVNGELHLIPIGGVLSLKPQLSHLEPPQPNSTNKAEELEQVRVQFARNESDRVKMLREQSYATYAKRVAQEEWYTTHYFDMSSLMSQDVRRKVKHIGQKDSVELTKEGYINSVAPEESKDKNPNPPALPDTLISLSNLRNLQASDRIKILLKQVMTVSLSQLVWVCGETEEKALQYVQECGVLVRGNWVLRSDLLFPKDTFSPHNGVPAEAMQRARDYVLYELNSSGSVERKSLSSLVRIPTEELKDIMSQVAVLKQNKMWTFRLPTDLNFIQRYPHIVEREERLWAARYERLKESLEATAPPPTPIPSPKKKDRRKRSTPSEEEPSKPKQQPGSKLANNTGKSSSTKAKKQHSEETKVNGLVCATPASKKEPHDAFQSALTSPDLTADCS